MDSSSVAAPLGIEEGFFGGSPSARTPLVEVIMLGPSSPKINSQANKSQQLDQQDLIGRREQGVWLVLPLLG